MKITGLLTVLLGFFAFTTHAQMLDIGSRSDNRVITERDLDGVKGSPYAVNKWCNTTVYSNEGEVMEGLLGKYNAEADAIEIFYKDKVVELNKHLYSKAVLVEVDDEGNQFTHFYENNLEKGDLGYHKLIYKGDKLAFTEKLRSEFQETTVANYGVSKNVKKFVKSSKNYLLVNGKLIPVKRNKKSIMEAIGDKKFERLVKKNKYKLKNDKEIILALTQYESMLAEDQ